MNTFMNGLVDATNFDLTENGAVCHRTTKSAILDMFSLCGAYRTRSESDCIIAFKNALAEDESLAVKCLFYLADCRGGQGERRFFRVCFKWLAKTYPEVAARNLKAIPEYRRWDDVIYSCMGTSVEKDALDFVKTQLVLDMGCKTPSLLAKWLPSENASALETRKAGALVRTFLGMTHKQYRKTLSELRSRINIVERLMSQNRWDEIEFDKIPSKAGLVYKNAFARRDIIAKKYESFAKDETKTVNASTLYPYDVIAKVVGGFTYGSHVKMSDTDRAIVEKYWNALPDYLNGKECKMLCVVDTSGSMTGSEAASPMNIAIGLGMYCAERIGGPFKDHYISFASRPQLIKIEGVDFVDKVQRIYKTNLCDNTDLPAVFNLLKSIALNPGTNKEDLPEVITVISDMEIDEGTGRWNSNSNRWSASSASTEMEKIRAEWAAVGLKLPRLVYWNVQARNNTILDAGPDVSFVSGASPVIFEQVLMGVTGYDLMLRKLQSERYKMVG